MESLRNIESFHITFVAVIELLLTILSAKYIYPIMRNKMNLFIRFFSVFMTIISLESFFIFTLAYEFYKDGIHNNLEKFVFGTPFIYIVSIMAVHLIILLFIGLYLATYNRFKVTANSIADGYNTIETGICIYQLNGITRIVNKSLERLSFAITGHYLYDGNVFVEELKKPKNGQKIEENGDRIIIKLNDLYYSFDFYEFEINGIQYKRIKAIDVTLEFKLLNELAEENKKRLLYQERLKKYSKDLEKITIDEEILKTKMNIHNDYGQILLIGKYSLKHPSRREEFIDRWNRVANLEFEEKLDDLKEFDNMAKSLGINFKINGEIKPENQNLVIKLLYEVLTNTVKHTKSNNIELNIIEDSDKIIYMVHNDEINNSDDFKEGGGLSSFKKVASKENAKVSYDLKPYFTVVLEIKRS